MSTLETLDAGRTVDVQIHGLIAKLESIATKLYDLDESRLASEIYWSIRNLISELEGQL